MSKRVIEFGLDPDWIDYAIKEIERFKKDLIKACNDLIRDLTALGIETAESTLTWTTVGFTGELEQSIYRESGWNATKRVGVVRTSCPYAAYVEFGTGIVGYGDHPMAAETGWEYDIHHHGADGWYYYNENVGHWVNTPGEPAKPFMYTAYTRVRDSAGRFAATVFAKL